MAKSNPNPDDILKSMLKCAHTIDWVRFFACYMGVLLLILVYGQFVNTGTALAVLRLSWVWGVMFFGILYYSGIVRKK